MDQIRIYSESMLLRWRTQYNQDGLYVYRRVDYCSLGRLSPYHSHATAATVLKVDYIMSVQKSGKAQGHCTTEKGSSPIIILLLYSAKDIQCPCQPRTTQKRLRMGPMIRTTTLLNTFIILVIILFDILRDVCLLNRFTGHYHARFHRYNSNIMETNAKHNECLGTPRRRRI